MKCSIAETQCKLLRNVRRKKKRQVNATYFGGHPFHFTRYSTLPWGWKKAEDNRWTMEANMGYSTRCNQSTDWNLQPKILFPITLFSKHCHFPIQLYLLLQTFGTQGCLSMLVLPSAWSTALQKAGKQNTKSQLESKTKPFTHSQANLQDVSIHKCRKEMCARSKCQMIFFFFKQREETQYIRTYEASLACSFSFATRSTQTLFHPSQALILLTQAISGSQLKFRAILFFFFFTLSTRLKK